MSDQDKDHKLTFLQSYIITRVKKAISSLYCLQNYIGISHFIKKKKKKDHVTDEEVYAKIQ